MAGNQSESRGVVQVGIEGVTQFVDGIQAILGSLNELLAGVEHLAGGRGMNLGLDPQKLKQQVAEYRSILASAQLGRAQAAEGAYLNKGGEDPKKLKQLGEATMRASAGQLAAIQRQQTQAQAQARRQMAAQLAASRESSLGGIGGMTPKAGADKAGYQRQKIQAQLEEVARATAIVKDSTLSEAGKAEKLNNLEAKRIRLNEQLAAVDAAEARQSEQSLAAARKLGESIKRQQAQAEAAAKAQARRHLDTQLAGSQRSSLASIASLTPDAGRGKNLYQRQKIQAQLDEVARATSLVKKSTVDEAGKTEKLNALDAKRIRLNEQLAAVDAAAVRQRERAFARSQKSGAAAAQVPLNKAQIASATKGTRQATDTSATGRMVAKIKAQEAEYAATLIALEETKVAALKGAATQRELVALTERERAQRAKINQALEMASTAVGQQVSSSKQAAVAAARQSKYGQARGEFMTGFRGASDVPYMQQAGQAAKFSLLYGAAYKGMFAITQTLHEALRQGVEFEQGLSDMAVATQRPKEELQGLAEQLAAQAANAGQSPSQGVEIGARAIGLYGATNAPLDVQKSVALTVNDVITKIAASNQAGGTQTDPTELATTVAAVTKAMGTGYAGVQMVGDLDAYYSKKFGIAQGTTLQGAQSASSVGMAAGFSPNQIVAMVADLINRTGQSGETVGGYLAQIFSRGGEGSLTKLDQQFGIDSSAPLAKQFDKLAKIYQSGSDGVRTEIAAAFGRGKVQNAVVALLKDYPSIGKQVKAAAGPDGAAGALDRTFNQHMDNIGGQLARLAGDLKEFAHLFGESGMLAGVGLVVKGFDQLVQALNNILGLYNLFPPLAKNVVGALAALAVAAKVGAAQSAAGFLMVGRGGVTRLAERGGRLGSLLTWGAAAPKPATGIEAAAIKKGSGTLIAGTEEGLAASAAVSGATKLGIVGSAVAMWPLAAAAGGIIAIGSIVGDMRKLHAATDQAVSMLARSPGMGASAAQYEAHANLLRNQANKVNDTGMWAHLFSGGQIKDQVTRLRIEADREAAVARQMQSHMTAAAPTQFGDFSPSAVEQGLSQITSTGGTAIQQLHALTGAIDGLGKHAARTATKVEPGRIAGTLARTAYTVRGKVPVPVPQGRTYDARNQFTQEGIGQFKGAIEKALPPQLIAKRLKAAMDGYGIKAFSDLNPQIAAQVAAQVGTLSGDQLGGVDDRTAHAISRAIQAAMRKRLMALARKFDKQVSGSSILTPDKATGLVNQSLAVVQARSEMRPQADLAGRVRDAKGLIRKINRVRKRTQGDDTGQVMYALRQAETMLVTSQVAKAEAAASNAGGEKTAAGRAIYQAEIRTLIKKGRAGADLLAQALANLHGWAKDYAQHYVDGINASRRAANQADHAKAAAGRRIAHRETQTAMKGRDANLLGKALSAFTPWANGYAHHFTSEANRIHRQAMAAEGDINRAGGLIDQALKATSEYADKALGFLADWSGGIADQIPALGYQIASRKSAMAAALAAGKPGAPPKKPPKLHLPKIPSATQQAITDAVPQEESAANKKKKKKADDARKNALELRAAKAAADAARRGGDIAAARAAIVQAQVDMELAKKGTADWYNALASLYNAQRDLKTALASAHAAQVGAWAARKGGDIAAAKASIAQARADLKVATKGTADYYNALASLYNAQRDLRTAVGSAQAAHVAAHAAQGAGDIGAAKASIAQAKADLKIATKGTADYYNALASLYQARQQLAEAIRSDYANRFLLTHDQTNPIDQAQAEVLKALGQVRYDRSHHAAGDKRRADRLALEQARSAKEDTVFNQRLQDIQTRENLGQITFAAEMAYYHHEHDRLSRIKHRTYQQQQELYQIDQLIKDAAGEMAGQWNFGDIKLPSPYQVRRYIDEQHAAATNSPAAAGNTMVANHTTTIYIDGADTGKVRKLINDVVGKNARVLTTAPRRK